MAKYKRIMISVPANLLTEIDGIGGREKMNRSDLIIQAVQMYLNDRKKRELIEQMKEGYQAMAEINLALAEEACATDDEQYKAYEKRLAESEKK